MNKKLLLVRHAKSDWGDSNLIDFNRPLNSRGLNDCIEMAQRIRVQKLVPQKLVSSPAVRAITTCKLMAETWKKGANDISLEPKIYEASAQTLLKLINAFDDKDDYVALFGHNNGITDLAVYLTDTDIFNIPTCGVVLIEFSFKSWKMISKNTGEVLMYDYPKNEM